MNNLNYNQSNKGFVLIWTLLLSAGLIVMATTMTSLVIKEMRMSVNIDESNRAYLAAEAGIEKAMLGIRVRTDNNFDWDCTVSGEGINLIDGNSNTIEEANYQTTPEGIVISYKTEATCLPASTKEVILTSTGKTTITGEENVSRTIKTKLGLSAPDEIFTFATGTGSDTDFDLPATVRKNSHTIIQQFDVWDLHKLGTIPLKVGMKTDANTDFYVKLTTSTLGPISMTLGGSVGGETIAAVVGDGGNDFTEFTSADGDYFRIKLEYSRSKNDSFSIIRAMVLKDTSAAISSGQQEKYACIVDPVNNYSYIVRTLVKKRGADPTHASINAGGRQHWYSGDTGTNYTHGYLGEQLIRIGLAGDHNFPTSAKLDNMVFWTRR